MFLKYSDLFSGSGIFIITIVSSLVAIVYRLYAAVPLVIGGGNFARNVGFYIVSLVVLFFVLWDGKITFIESIGVINLYILYILAAFVFAKINKRQKLVHFSRGKERI